jgi:hypothetical protein
MPRGRPSPKLAISVDPDVHAAIIRAASEDDVTVSAWMTQAARRAITARDGLLATEEWEAEHGALSDDEMAAARVRIRFELEQQAPRSA